MLADVSLPELANQHFAFTGIDSPYNCPDKHWWNDFDLPIHYDYNQRGFRDRDWPDPLQDAVWCIGDSFTVGLGLPFECTWPQQLQTRCNRPVINVSMDGASNQWISRMATIVREHAHPYCMIIMWSYAHRRELANSGLTDLQRRQHFHYESDAFDDFTLLKTNVLRFSSTDIIHTVIPNFHELQDVPMIWQQIRGVDWPWELPLDRASTSASVQKEIAHQHQLDPEFWQKLSLYWQFDRLKQQVRFIEYDQIDWARDKHHLGVETCRLLADKIAQAISVP